MPAWHLKSTISGDLTALGIKENAQSAASAPAVVSPGSLDESLIGLGKVVRPSSLQAQATADEADEDVKPAMKEGNEADCKRSPTSLPNPCNPLLSHTPLFFFFLKKTNKKTTTSTTRLWQPRPRHRRNTRLTASSPPRASKRTGSRTSSISIRSTSTTNGRDQWRTKATRNGSRRESAAKATDGVKARVSRDKRMGRSSSSSSCCPSSP